MIHFDKTPEPEIPNVIMNIGGTFRIKKPTPFSKQQKLILVIFFFLAAAFLIVGSFSADSYIQQQIFTANHGHWSQNPVVAAFSKFGDWPELMLAGGLGFLVAKKLRSARWQRILLCAMLASTLAGATVNLSRLTTGRTRPRAVVEQGWYGPYHNGKWLVGKADFNSFPSGHTATAVGFAGVILIAAPGWGIPAMLVAFAVALSRILLGAHHPSDVVTAAVLALAIAWALWEFFGKKKLRGDEGSSEILVQS